MKIINFAVIGIMLVGGLSSCERNYTCTCVYPGAAVGTTKTDFKAAKKADAEANCNAQNNGAKINGGSCAL